MNLIKVLMRRFFGMVCAILITLGLFLVLPLMQSIAKPPDDLVSVGKVHTADFDVPDDPIEEEEPPEDPPEEPELPDIEPEPQMLDLNQLEMALNPSSGIGGITADLGMDLTNIIGGGGNDLDDLFDMGELDQKPRVLYQAAPNYTDAMRRQAPGTVYIVFIVSASGRVENPTVQSSTHQVFEQPALAAVRQWRFEPGQRKGEAVPFRMRIPITFPKP